MNKKQLDTESSHIQAQRAADELRRQIGIVLQSDNSTIALYSIECMSAEYFARLRTMPDLRLTLVVTRARAENLGLQVSGPAFAIEVDDLPYETLMAIADPTRTNSIPVLSSRPTDMPVSLAAIALAKAASLLPAMLLIEGSILFAKDWLTIRIADILDFTKNPSVEVLETASAHLPITGAENTTIVSFREQHGMGVHLALIIGDISVIPSPLVRIHSSCVTGDILGSLRCDCGDQLQLALSEIIKEGAGILLYLHQEGRGIGITNKLRAYKLQERGIDTYTANLMLGFDEDERDFAIGAAMLKKLGSSSIRLLTNNPEKINHLQQYGIHVNARLPLLIKPGLHNHAYIEAKGNKAGHFWKIL